jgi:hypothetical protein
MKFDRTMNRNNRTTRATKIWIGVGAFVVASGTATAGARLPEPAADPSVVAFGTTDSGAIHAPAPSAAIRLAQHNDHPKDPKEAGEGGETKGLANLPPDLAFGVRLALLRGHLGVGDELVKLKQWNAALPHFLHPSEEIYDDLRDQLDEYKIPAFDGALKTLVAVVKAKKGGEYAKALKAVNDALATADARLKDTQADWGGFLTEAAIEAIKTGAGEYQNAIVGNRIAKPVEYQDARGFIWQAERMIDSAAAELQKKDAAALKDVRAGLDELKRVFPAAMPPSKPVKDHATVLAIIARMELAAGKLM